MGRRRFEPEHMGAWLKSELLDDYELSPAEFATAIRAPLEHVERVLEGLEPVDADLALRLARLFGGSAAGWLRWQQGYELWRAHERIAEEIDAIVPLDPNTRVSVREDEPLGTKLIEELRRRIDDVRDPRRWVVVSRISGDDAPLHDECLTRMFYNVESGCYCTNLRGATAFKRESVAEAVAEAIGERKGVVEVMTRDLEKPRWDDAVDREVQERFFRNTGQGMSEWDIGAYLRDEADMTAYLEAAAEDATPRSIAAAIADVMKAMKAQTTVEYLEARGELASREAYEAAMAKVRDGEPIEPTVAGDAAMLHLKVLPELLAVCRLPAGRPDPEWLAGTTLTSVTRSADETSIVCDASVVPSDVTVESGWRAIKVLGPLDFSLTGILLSIAQPLADAGVSIFVLSTYDTDYVLVKESALPQAVETLSSAGHYIG